MMLISYKLCLEKKVKGNKKCHVWRVAVVDGCGCCARGAREALYNSKYCIPLLVAYLTSGNHLIGTFRSTFGSGYFACSTHSLLARKEGRRARSQAMATAAPPPATSGSDSSAAGRETRTQEEEALPPTLDSNSQAPNLSDGATRLYISYICPYVQRVWIARNFKGLQDKIQLVAIDLQDKPAWFLEKVYPPGKVPVLEHNGNTIPESLDLLSYLDAHFEGPKLFPQDPAEKVFADELISSSDSVVVALFRAGRAGGDGDGIGEMVAPALDKVEEALGRFSDGPFFLGKSMSAVDMVYAPFVERFKDFFSAVKKYDMTQGRPKLKEWIEELNKIDAYAATWGDRRLQIAAMMKKFGLEIPVA